MAEAQTQLIKLKVNLPPDNLMVMQISNFALIARTSALNFISGVAIENILLKRAYLVLVDSKTAPPPVPDS